MVPANDGQSDFSVGHLKVDLLRRRVSIRGQEVHLSPIGYRPLSVLVKHAGKTLTGNCCTTSGVARAPIKAITCAYTCGSYATSSKRSRPGRTSCSRR